MSSEVTVTRAEAAGVPKAATHDHGFRETDNLKAITLLTPRQRCVLEQVGRGLSNKQIARELRIVDTTVKAHVAAILKKLRCSNRTKLALIALRYQRHRTEIALTPSISGRENEGSLMVKS